MKLKTVLSEILSESKQVGIVYHFTSLYGAIKIVEDNRIKAGRATKNINGKTISTTRNKHFSKQRIDGELQIQGAYFAFELDGTALSNRYKVKPYDDTYDAAEKEYDEDDKIAFGDEQEEVWFGNALEGDGGFKNVKRFVNKIIITKKFKKDLLYSPNKLSNSSDKSFVDSVFPNMDKIDSSPVDKMNEIINFFKSKGFVVELEK